MKFLALALKLLLRERAQGEWRILLLALIIGVGSVSTTGFLVDRFKRAMNTQGATFLGADVLVNSPRPVTAALLNSAPAQALQNSRALEFTSMLSKGESFQLATVRAVDASYPLRGEVQIAPAPYTAGVTRPAQPPAGSIYVEASLLPLLVAQVGDSVQIGQAQFAIAGVVAQEPGQLAGLFGLAPRVFMRADELERTQVLLPGSRVNYLYFFAGGETPVREMRDHFKTQLDSTQRLLGARDGVETLRGPWANTDRYLQLAGLMSLLLAVVAIAIAAQRHAVRHFDQAALLRCLGMRTAQLRTLYVTQLLILGLMGCLIGIALGVAVQQGLALWLAPAQLKALPPLRWAPAGIALLSGLVALAGASLPSLLRLINVSPLRVLRRELPPLPLSAWISVGISAASLLLLMAWYAGEARLLGLFLLLLFVWVGSLALLSRGVLWGGRKLYALTRGPLRFGLGQLLRHHWDSTLQLSALTLALFLVGSLALLRTELIQGWREQLPQNAPNYFLVNIAPEQQASVHDYLGQHQLQASALYPMVRGRLVSKNGVTITDTLPTEKREDNLLRRELNLTWATTLPPNNVIKQGQWHGQRQQAEISVEVGMANRLNLKLGDELGFLVGDQPVQARITSLRTVKWDSLQPNFFVIFAPGQIEQLPFNAIASVHVPSSNHAVLPGLVKNFPGVTLLALDKLIANVETMFAQIIQALELLFSFLLAAGLAVVVATLLASLDARRQEAVLLRTLGATRSYLVKAFSSEFVALGLLAGLLASVCAEIAMAGLAYSLFELPVRLHPWIWLTLPAVGAVTVGLCGALTTRHMTRVPPVRVLRELA